MGPARGALPHGAWASFRSTLGQEGLYSGAAPSLWFYLFPRQPILLSCASQGLSVPSLTYLLLIPWLGRPEGQGGLLLRGGGRSWPGVREGNKHEEDACSLPEPPLLTFPTPQRS